MPPNSPSSRLINARGTFTPLGVSRSPASVAHGVAAALHDFHLIAECQAALDTALQDWSGAEAGCASHCTAASITLAVAACLTGLDATAIAALPQFEGPKRILIPKGHCVNYGQSILQAIRLSGAEPLVVGTDEGCSPEDIEEALELDDVAGLLLVSSRLTNGDGPDIARAVELAHARSLPVILDGAAQDFRIKDLVATKADLILVSAQKYLAAPTAGLVVGRRALVDAVKAQEAGIGRAMKASKEAIFGVLAALDARGALDVPHWSAMQREKAEHFINAANQIDGIKAHIAPDPTGLPFGRPCLEIDAERYGCSAQHLSDQLRGGSPSIWVMDHLSGQGQLFFELVPLEEAECKAILDRLAHLHSG